MKEGLVEVKIGVQDTVKEINLETNDSAEVITKAINAAVADGSLLTLTDDKGRTIMVPGNKIGYVELSAETTRRVGFGH
jgi:hypothetical protein